MHKLKANDFNLKPYQNAKQQAKNNTPNYSGIANDFYKVLEDKNKEAFIKDYSGRNLQVKYDDFTKHTTGIYAKEKNNRVVLLNAMRETLKKPDEIWLNRTHIDMDTMFYLKYYKNKTIVTVVRLDGLIPSVKTWFTLVEKDHIINKYRSGLLLLKK